MDIALKAADAENKGLARRNIDLVESKGELQKRYVQLMEVRNF